jgi:hypothetical protein
MRRHPPECRLKLLLLTKQHGVENPIAAPEMVLEFEGNQIARRQEGGLRR